MSLLAWFWLAAILLAAQNRVFAGLYCGSGKYWYSSGCSSTGCSGCTTGTSCRNCPAGTYNPSSNAINGCTACAVNYYSSVQSSSCTACPSGTYTISTCSTSLSDCLTLPTSQPTSQPSSEPSTEVSNNKIVFQSIWFELFLYAHTTAFIATFYIIYTYLQFAFNVVNAANYSAI